MFFFVTLTSVLCLEVLLIKLPTMIRAICAENRKNKATTCEFWAGTLFPLLPLDFSGKQCASGKKGTKQEIKNEIGPNSFWQPFLGIKENYLGFLGKEKEQVVGREGEERLIYSIRSPLREIRGSAKALTKLKRN